MKTNKSFTKRIKVTKNGKLIARRPGMNHLNAKASSKNKRAKKRAGTFLMNKKARSLFLPNENA